MILRDKIFYLNEDISDNKSYFFDSFLIIFINQQLFQIIIFINYGVL
jgi:hypothetical protein